MLIGAMTPCPCGYYGDRVQECTCSNAMVSRYQADKRHPANLGAAAGPRQCCAQVDIHIEVPRVEYEKLSDDRLGEPSAAIHKRVEAARARQEARLAGTRMLANADMGPGEVRDYCRLDDAGKSLLKAAMQQHRGGTCMSARAYHRILKLARTIADPSMPQGRPGRQRRDPDSTFGEGDSVQTEKTKLNCDPTSIPLRKHCHGSQSWGPWARANCPLWSRYQ
jgi:magnesium chelatase family protein